MPKATIRMTLAVLLVLAAANSVLGDTGVVKKVLGGDIVQIGDTFVARLTGIAAPCLSTVIACTFRGSRGRISRGPR